MLVHLKIWEPRCSSSTNCSSTYNPYSQHAAAGTSRLKFPHCCHLGASSSLHQEKFIIVQSPATKPAQDKQQFPVCLFHTLSSSIQAIWVAWERFTCCPWMRTALPGACPTWRGDVLIKLQMMLFASEEGDEEGEGKDGAKVIVFRPMSNLFLQKDTFLSQFYSWTPLLTMVMIISSVSLILDISHLHCMFHLQGSWSNELILTTSL